MLPDPAKLDDIRDLMASFYEPGTLEGGGVTRLAYTPVEDEMHRIFRRFGERQRFRYYTDEVGNSFLSNPAADRAAARGEKWHLIGSHLDSVVQGGRFDGVAGVVGGMACLKWLKDARLEIPLRVAAFRCEESANFGRSTVGSGLITHTIDGDAIADFTGKDGWTFREVFATRGLSLKPEKISGMSDYVELHIEQGKVLENLGLPLGIVQAIAAPRRFRAFINGMADHSGATPMDMRADALCAASEFILAVENAGRIESASKSVATVGIIRNSPNVMNVIPGSIELGIDTRGIDISSIDRMEKMLRDSAARISAERNVTISLEKRSEDSPALMDEAVQEKLRGAARSLDVAFHDMASGAGHDALGFSEICPAGMLFIPCRGGISHNKEEYTDSEAVCLGARVLYGYLQQ